MIIAIVLGIIVLTFALVDLLPDADRIGEYICRTIVSLFLCFAVMMTCLAFSRLIGVNISNNNYTLTSSSPIVALKDDKITRGHFFLGCGGVDGDLRYYYAEDSSRGYKVKSIDIDNCYILFDDDHPRIERYDATAFNKKRHYIYALPCGHYYKLYIPHGSITTEFKVDLE